jgi:hypothetical protein
MSCDVFATESKNDNQIQTQKVVVYLFYIIFFYFMVVSPKQTKNVDSMYEFKLLQLQSKLIILILCCWFF